MNNQRRCFFCSSGVMKFQPITNKKGEIISLHNICQSCNKDQTKHSLAKKKKTLLKNSKRTFKTSKPKSRLLKGMLVILASAALSYNLCIGLASADFISNTVSFQAPQTATSTSTIAPKEPVVVKSETIKEKILKYALKYDVDPRELENIVRCETGSQDVNKASTTIQSRYLIGTPRRELSFGVAQIHISAHGIPKELAYDVDYSLDFLASHWAKGHQSMWKNCSLKYGYL